MTDLFKKNKSAGIILVVLISYMIFSRIKLLFSYSTDLDGLEFMFIHYIQNILKGKALYGNVYTFPFDTVIHMPLYSYATAAILKLLHLTSVYDIHKQLILLRFISLCFLPVSVFYLLRILWLYNKDSFVSIAVICFYMSFLTGHFYAMRQDAIKTTFFLIFLYYSISFIKNKPNYRYLWFIFLSVLLSISLKQDIVIYIGLFLFALLLCNYLKQFLLISSIFVLAIIIILVSGYLISGTNFINNTILLNLQVNNSNLTSYNFYAFLFSLIRTIPLLTVLIYLHVKNAREISNKNELKAIVLFSYMVYFISHLLIFRASSYINYTHEAMATLTIATGALIKDTFFTKRNLRIMILFLLVLLFSNLLIHAYPLANKNERLAKEKYETNLKNIPAIDTVIQSNTVYFTTSDNTIFYPDKNVVFGYDYHIDRFVYAYLGFKTNTKLLGLSTVPYDKYIAAGNIVYIIANNNIRDAKIITDHFQGYYAFKKVNNLVIYKKDQKYSTIEN